MQKAVILPILIYFSVLMFCYETNTWKIVHCVRCSAVGSLLCKGNKGARLASLNSPFFIPDREPALLNFQKSRQDSDSIEETNRNMSTTLVTWALANAR